MRKTVVKLEREICPPARYMRFWDPSTSEPFRRLRCYKYQKGICFQEIPEAEYLAETGGGFSNAEIEAQAGQVNP